MLDIAKFHDVFPAGLRMPYDRKLLHEIEEHRRSLDGTLFIDRVMRALGIKGRVYPPRADNALRQLHQQICEAGMSVHHKQSLLYYLMLDFDVEKGQQSASEGFAAESGMPSNYQVFMKGLWHLDRQEYHRALEYVTHPSLSPDFADDIVVTLVRHAPGGDSSLALSYFYTVRPILKSSLALELLFDAMARHTRELLFRRLVSSVLGSGRGEESSHNNELALLPLDPAEEEWLVEYLSNGQGRTLKGAKDTLLIRQIVCDRFAEAGKQRAGGQWAAVLEGIKSGIEGRAD